MRINWKSFIPYGIVIILFVFATFYDYEINMHMAHVLNGFDIFMERFAILPLIILMVLCFQLYYQEQQKILFQLLSMVLALYAGFDTMHYWNDGLSFYVSSIVLAIFIWVIVSLIAKVIPFAHRQQLAYWLMYFTMVLLLSMLVTSILKCLWGRVRFRDGAGIIDFTPWYLPQGINGHQSFPSGHTTAWSAILCFTNISKHRPLSWWQTLLLYGFIILMPLTRMSCGAHYLSDTLMGFSITYTIFLWMSVIYKKRRLL